MWLLDTNSLITWKKTNTNIPSLMESIYTSIFNIIEFPPAITIKSLIILHPTQQTYENGLIYASKMRDNGTPMHAIDLLIGALALEHQLSLVTNNGDFNAFNEIEPQLGLISWESFVMVLNKVQDSPNQ